MRTPIEQYIIDKVRDIRNSKGKSQAWLSYEMGFESTGYIGAIESPNPENEECYNVNHLNQIAKILGCSPRDFWPDEAL